MPAITGRTPAGAVCDLCRAAHAGLLFGLAALSVVFALGAAAAPPASASPIAHLTIPGVSPIPLTPLAPSVGTLEEFVTQTMQRQIQKQGVVGAVVAVVHDGEMLFATPYGMADLASERLVDAESTLFRLGSVSKLFTATAVMQLVDQDLLDLDADVRQYLPVGTVPVPMEFEPPVTLKNLLTHTTGFEANTLGYLQKNPAQTGEPFGVVLAENAPAQVLPPVTNYADALGAAYNNWAVALAGYVVQQVSGVPFAQYIEANIFAPLGMQHSSFRGPLPKPLAANLATGYTMDEPPQPRPFQNFQDMMPAASMSSTGPDMAQFMIAQLQLGRFGDQRILSEDSARLMQSRVMNPNSYVNGGGLGWFEDYWNGRLVLKHLGKTLFFNSELYLLPEDNFGVFLAYNRQAPVSGALMDAIMDEYFPAELPRLVPHGGPPDVGRHAGSYTSTVRSLTTWEKVLGLLDTIIVRDVGAGELQMHSVLGGMVDSETVQNSRGLMGISDQIFAAVTPHGDVFRSFDSETMTAFATAADGRHYMLGSTAFNPYVRVPWYESPKVNVLWLGYCVLSFVGCVLLLVVARARGSWPNAGSPGLMLAISLANIVVLLCLLRLVTSRMEQLLYSLPWSAYLMMGLGLASLASTALWFALPSRPSAPPSGSNLARVLRACWGLAAIAFLLWLYNWRLLGFHVA